MNTFPNMSNDEKMVFVLLHAEIYFLEKIKFLNKIILKLKNDEVPGFEKEKKEGEIIRNQSLINDHEQIHRYIKEKLEEFHREELTEEDKPKLD